MDQEVVPRPCKMCDWPLNSSHDHFGLHQGNNVRVTMKFEVPKRHILMPTLSTNMVQRVLQWVRQKGGGSSRKRQGPMVENWCYHNFLMIFSLRKRRRRQENDKSLIFFSLKTSLFEHIVKKTNTFTFGAWSLFFLAHIRFTPSERPKGFIN